MASSNTNTHRSGALDKFFRAFGIRNPNPISINMTRQIHDHAVNLNNDLLSLPRWMSAQRLKALYINEPGAKQYKTSFRISKKSLDLLVFSVVFVVFIFGGMDFIKWTVALIQLIHKKSFDQTATEETKIDSRKALKIFLGVKTLASNNMQSMEKLLLMKRRMRKSSAWTSYGEIQQNVIIGLTYFQAINAGFGSANISTVRKPLPLMNIINHRTQNEQVIDGRGSYNETDHKEESTTTQIPRSSLKILLEEIPDDIVVTEIINEMRKRKYKFKSFDDAYNIQLFETVLVDRMRDKTDNILQDEDDNDNKNGHENDKLYRRAHANLFENFNSELFDDDSSMDVSHLLGVDQISNESHKEILENMIDNMEFDRYTVLRAYEKAVKTYANEIEHDAWDLTSVVLNYRIKRYLVCVYSECKQI